MQALKVLVVVMGVMIVAGVVALGVVMTQRLSDASRSGPMQPAVLDEPAGTRISGAAALADRVVIQLQGGGPDRVVVVDLRSGKVVGQVGLAR